MVIFFVDSCLSFRVAIIENDILITDSREIAKNYLRLVFIALPSMLDRWCMFVPASCLDLTTLCFEFDIAQLALVADPCHQTWVMQHEKVMPHTAIPLPPFEDTTGMGCSARFWVDFAAWFPFDWIVLWCFDAAQSNNFHRWLGLLTLLRMVHPRLCICACHDVLQWSPSDIWAQGASQPQSEPQLALLSFVACPCMCDE